MDDASHRGFADDRQWVFISTRAEYRAQRAGDGEAKQYNSVLESANGRHRARGTCAERGLVVGVTSAKSGTSEKIGG